MRTLFFFNPSFRPLKLSSKRVENQLKDLGEKAEKKKVEVRAHCAPLILTCESYLFSFLSSSRYKLPFSPKRLLLHDLHVLNPFPSRSLT